MSRLLAPNQIVEIFCGSRYIHPKIKSPSSAKLNMARTSTMLTFCIFALANLPALAKPLMTIPFLGPVEDGASDQCHAEDAVSQCNLAISADGVLMDCRHWCWPALLPDKTAADFDATGCGVRTFWSIIEK